MAHDEMMTFFQIQQAFIGLADPQQNAIAFGAVECDNEDCSLDRCREMVVYLRLQGQEISLRFTLEQAEGMATMVGSIVKRQRDDIAADRGAKHHVH